MDNSAPSPEPTERPQPPAPSETATPPEQVDRPIAILVFAILNIIWGVLGLGMTLLTVAGLFTFAATDPPVDPYHIAMEESAAYTAIVYGLAIVHMVFSVVILAAGVGLWLNKSWGRTLSLIWVAYYLVSILVNSGANWIWVMQDLVATTDTSTAEGQGRYYGYFIGFFGCSCALFVYPILLGIWMNMPNVVAWLNRPEHAEPATESF